ncbi:MAG: NAD(P)-dependent oxidoreductase [Muribaculaceae bacterium]|nr:NAD(P)-dependent oxidoreductase [Muribaculaceae bacterium]
MKKVFLTGATGVMGMKGMQSILERRDSGMDLQLTVLARPSKRNHKKLKPFIKRGVNVIWGDLLDEAAIERGVCEADLVLHVGGMVSPAADWEPVKTYKVNTEAMALIVNAAKRREARGEEVEVVYIGSVAQYGNRSYPYQWGRVGDPLRPACFDMYALSKCVAERTLSESGLKKWVSLRQTGILHPGLLGKADNPIAFHVPMATGLEWVSDDDSGRLLAALCDDGIPKNFWKNYYNIGGGDSYRMSNYDFVKVTLSAVGCPPPEKVFELNWFATGNFHGMYYQDSGAYSYTNLTLPTT